MRLVTYRTDGGPWRPGFLDGAEVRDSAALAAAAGVDVDCSSNRTLLAAGSDAIRALAAVGGAESLPLAEVELGPPVPDPQKIVCLGLNYRDHAAETGMPEPAAPILFAKFANSLIGHGAPIVRPTASEQIDYEAELAVVIGRKGKNIPKERAYEHVFGYTTINDVTARDRQRNHKQWFLGKALDTFCPMGPWVATADEVEPENLEVKCWVNGELRQDANTRDLIFDIPTLIATISQGMTLVPGDIISTGTPAGVGIGMKPPTFLKSGDVVEMTITGLGKLSNPFV